MREGITELGIKKHSVSCYPGILRHYSLKDQRRQVAWLDRGISPYRKTADMVARIVLKNTSHHTPICHAIPPKLLWHQCWYYLSRPKDISALSFGSFIRAHIYYIFLTVYTLSAAIPVHRASVNNLFFFPKQLSTFVPSRNRYLRPPGWQLTECFINYSSLWAHQTP